jgi:putative transposase
VGQGQISAVGWGRSVGLGGTKSTRRIITQTTCRPGPFSSLEVLIGHRNGQAKREEDHHSIPRANRHYIPGHLWHSTDRRHQKEFLPKFAKDRQGWLDWLFEAKKGYGVVILNYMAPFNRIHLLVHDRDGGEVISKSVQMAPGRTAQQHNQRKNRKGAFWEDRYHAMAVQTGEHMVQCIVTMDLNMVRAGVVKHPSEWPHSGYGEIQNAPERYRLIDRKALMQLLGIGGSEPLSLSHRRWVEEALKSEVKIRESRWSESIAVGGLSFIEQVKTDLGSRDFGRKITSSEAGHELRETQLSYRDHFGCEKDLLSHGNALPWRVYGEIPM